MNSVTAQRNEPKGSSQEAGVGPRYGARIQGVSVTLPDTRSVQITRLPFVKVHRIYLLHHCLIVVLMRSHPCIGFLSHRMNDRPAAFSQMTRLTYSRRLLGFDEEAGIVAHFRCVCSFPSEHMLLKLIISGEVTAPEY